MTRTEALEYVKDRELAGNGVVLGPGYIECELQFIWDSAPSMPINEIMSLGFDRSEAQMLWNARKTHHG